MVGYLDRPESVLGAIAGDAAGTDADPHAAGVVAFDQGTTKFDLNLTFAETAGDPPRPGASSTRPTSSTGTRSRRSRPASSACSTR